MCFPVRSRRFFVLLALCALASAAAVAQEAGQEPGAAEGPQETAQEGAARELPDTWHAQAVARTETALNVTYFWSKGDRLRAETVVAGRRVITIVTGDTYYAYDALLRTGIAVQRSERAVAQDAERDRPFGNDLAAIRRQGAEKIREEPLGGGLAELYQVTNKQGRSRLWVTKEEPQLPIRLELYRRATGTDMATDYLSWQRGLPISDDFFRPEPGINMLVITLDEYIDRQSKREPIGPAPVFYSDLLHGY